MAMETYGCHEFLEDTLHNFSAPLPMSTILQNKSSKALNKNELKYSEAVVGQILVWEKLSETCFFEAARESKSSTDID